MEALMRKLAAVVASAAVLLGMFGLAQAEEPAPQSFAWDIFLPLTLGQPSEALAQGPSSSSLGLLDLGLGNTGQGGYFGAIGASGTQTPPAGATPTSGEATATASPNLANYTAPTPTQMNLIAEPSATVLTGSESAVRGTTDVGDLLAKSFSSTGLVIQRRNQIIGEPHLRAFRQGQIITQADGAYWFPARPDLDTIVSKIDSSNVANIVVIKGPYSVRHGPSFSVIDIESIAPPRYQNGVEYHGSSSFVYKTNNQAWSGQQGVWGGGADYGFRATWDSLTGNDYYAGNGAQLPSSYNSQNFNVALGMDLSDITHLDIKALRIMQRNVEIPGTISDLRKLTTDGITTRFVADETHYFTKFVFETWYNQTTFAGDDFSTGKKKQIPELDGVFIGQDTQFGQSPRGSLALVTGGDGAAWGYREYLTWGRENELQFTFGTDLHYLSQRIDERNTIFVNTPIQQGFILDSEDFGVPRGRTIDPGIFIDGAAPISERFTVRAGGRIDFYQTGLQSPVANLAQLQANLGPNVDMERYFTMGMGYLTSDFKYNDNWTVIAGGGYAQRAPTLVELYSNQTFLGLLQNGFVSNVGNPGLRREQLYQVDLGVRGQFENVRLGATGYAGWVKDFITYRLTGETGDLAFINTIIPEYQFINTPRATLMGAESYVEVDVVEWLAAFGTFSYLDGRDRTRRETLPGMWPMEGRAGIRIHDAQPRPRWAVEVSSRMVASQNQFAKSLLEEETAGFTIFDARAYWAVRQNLLLTMGVENFTDRGYREHLDLRTGLGVYQPGINYYTGVRWSY